VYAIFYRLCFSSFFATHFFGGTATAGFLFNFCGTVGCLLKARESVKSSTLKKDQITIMSYSEWHIVLKWLKIHFAVGLISALSQISNKSVVRIL
jgi:hypothetical protein